MGYILSLVIAHILQGIIPNIGELESLTLEIADVPFEINFPIKLVCVIGIIVYIIVLISVLLPLRKIKKIDIITGVKGSYKNKKTKRRQKVPFIVNKLFGQEGAIAYKYTKREKSRHTTIVSSITVSVLVFLIVNGIVGNFIKNLNKLTYDDYSIETAIGCENKVIDYLQNNNLIDGYYIQTAGFQLNPSPKSSYSDLFVDIPKDKISSTFADLFEKENVTLPLVSDIQGSDYNVEGYKFTVLPYYFDEMAYNYILKKAGINELKENECILLNAQNVENSVYGDYFEITNYKKGDNISIFGTGRKDNTSFAKTTKNIANLKIAGIVNDFDPYTPTDYKLTDYSNIIVIMLSKDMYEKELQNETISSSTIYISTHTPYEIDNRMNEIEDLGNESQYIAGENIYEQRLSEESVLKLQKFILYAFDILITLFCMTNIFNIISSSTIFRKKDFAILRSMRHE